MPSISAIVPTFNRAHLIGEALESAFGQTRPPNEVVIVDDGSTDNTREIVEKFGSKVRYIRQENAGPSAARNRAIQAATGDFMALLDSDDLWPENRLELQLSALAKYPELDFIFGIEAKFSGTKEAARINPADYFDCLDKVDTLIPNPLEMVLKENFFIGTSSVFFRKSCVEKVGLFDVSLRLAEDYEYWLRFVLAGCHFGFVNAVLCYRRYHGGNLVKEALATKASVANILTGYRDRIPGHREILMQKLRGLHYDLGSAFLKRCEWEQAYGHLAAGRDFNEIGLLWRVKLAAASLLRFLPATGSA